MPAVNKTAAADEFEEFDEAPKPSGPTPALPSSGPAPTHIASPLTHIHGYLGKMLQESWPAILWQAEKLGPEYETLKHDIERAHTMMQILASSVNHTADQAHKGAGMLLEKIQKAAEELDLVNTEDARQAVEGLEAVLVGCAENGVIADAAVLDRLMRTAGFLDDNYKHGAADLLDKVALAAGFPHAMPRGESREEMYDHTQHNLDGMWEIVKHEIAENRREANVEGQRGSADSLSTRYDPELPGVPVYHVADGVYQSNTTHKVYDYNHGYTRTDGEKNPGGSVSNQTPRLNQYSPVSQMFETRTDVGRRRA